MKSLLIVATAIFFSFSATAQTTHNVSVSNFAFTPPELTVEVGDIVRWTNIGGQHSVDANAITFPNNPEPFGNAIGPAGWVYEFTFTQVGTYAYRCGQHAGSMFGTVTVATNPLSVSDQTEDRVLNFYPNPANSFFTWKWNNALSGQDLQLHLFNILGQKVVEISLATANRVDVSAYEAGVYFYQVSDGSAVLQSGKLLIKH